MTVVIPTYNRVERISRSIASVQAQTEAVAAIIIVDDGSTDDTRALIERYARNDPRITLIRQANSGANVARNKGVSSTGTDLVAFLDSDDRWHPKKIERQLHAWRDKPAAVASFTGHLGVDGERLLYHHDIPSDPSLDDIRCRNALGTTSTAIVRADTMRNVGGFDPALPVCQDWDLWLRLRRAGPFSVVNNGLVLFEDGRHDRITHGDPARAVTGHRAVFANALSDVVGWRSRALVRASHAGTLSMLYRHAGRRRAASREAFKALMLDPKPCRARKLVGAMLMR